MSNSKEVENRNGAASMNMLGNSVFSHIPFKGCGKMRISYNGVKIEN